MKFFRFAFLVSIFFFTLKISGESSFSGPLPRLEGMSLEQALHQLQLQGLNIIYSSDLIDSRMKVMEEPKGTTPTAVLDDLLSDHGLMINQGPHKTLLVVRDPYAELRAKKPQHLAEKVEGHNEFVVVPYVSIDVSARDSGHHFVTSLRPDDFIIKEDGKQLNIDHFYGPDNSQNNEDNIPLTVLFLMDASRSMNPDPKEQTVAALVKEAALRLAEELHVPDQGMVIEFNEKTWIASPMTSQLENVRQSILDYKVVLGWTGMLDAVMTGLQEMDKYSGRKLIVLCSDGRDNASHTPLDDVLHAVQGSDVTILSVGPKFSGFIAENAREVLEKIAEESGGYAFFPESARDVDTMLSEARKAMRSQYVLGYTPPNPFQRGWRKVEIECKVEGIHLRYRKSYLF